MSLYDRMPQIPILPNQPMRRIQVEKSEFVETSKAVKTVSNLEEIRKIELSLKEKQLIAREKERVGEEEYQRRVALRLRHII